MENDDQNSEPRAEPSSEIEKKRNMNLALALAAGQLGFLVAAGLLGGLWVDKKFGTTPAFGFVGLIGGFYSGIRLLMRLVRNNR